MKRFLPLFVLLAGCAFWPPRILAVETTLASAYNLDVGTEVQLTDLATSITVDSVNNGYFLLVNAVVTNTGQNAAHVILRLHESTSAITDSQKTVLVPPGTHTIQLPAQTTGAALGLGSSTFQVFVTKDGSGTFTFQPTTFLGVFSDVIPMGTIIDLNGLTAAVQTFTAADVTCDELEITSAGSDHEFCVPLRGNTSSLCVGNNCVISSIQATCVGEGSNCAAANSIGLGNSAHPVANSGCIGSSCSTESAGMFSIGGAVAPLTQLCLGGPGCMMESPSSLSVDLQFHPTDAITTINENGLGMKVRGGGSTGTGVSGNFYLDYCPSGSTGSTACTPAHAWLVKGSDGMLRPWADATFDLADTTHRVRAGYFNNLDVEGTLTFQDGSTALCASDTGCDLGTALLRFGNIFSNSLITDAGEATDLLIDSSVIPDADGGADIGSASTAFAVAYLNRIHLKEVNADPCGTMSSGTGVCEYHKGDKIIYKFNDGGTVRWKYLDLTGTGVTWVAVTSAP